jgi:hypothetical protein|tara:strand:+ start:2459 stop:6787 length:4329 start_codon:yes stop_codon:yes gene_type:complete
MSEEVKQLIETQTGGEAVDIDVDKVVNEIVEEEKPEVVTKDLPKKEEEKIEVNRVETETNKLATKEINNSENINVTDKPATEETSWFGGLKNWYNEKLAENERKYADSKKQLEESRKILQKSVTGKIIRGLINGRIASINELYEFGDDVLDLVMGDLYNSNRPADFDLIGYKEGSTNFGFQSPIGGEFEDDEGATYGISKAISQWIIPTGLVAKSLKKIGLKKFRYAIAGGVVDASLTDPYDANFFDFIEDRFDVANPVLDFLTTPETDADEFEKAARRLTAVVTGLVVGEGIIGKGLPVAGKVVKGVGDKTLQTFFGIKDITKELAGKNGNQLIEFVMDQFYNMKKNPKRRSVIIAKLNDIIQKNGADINKIEVDNVDNNLLVSLNNYKKNLQTSKKLKKYFLGTVGGDGKSLFGVPLKGSKITRTFNAHHLYTKFFVDMKGRTDPNAVFEYINARAAVIKEANKKNVRSLDNMFQKARTQLPLDTYNAIADFVERYGAGGEIDLQASVIAMNDLILESGIVLRDLSSQMHEMLKLSKSGSMNGDYYDVLKNDFAFTLKFLSDTLNVKNAFGSEIGKTLAVMQKTSGDIPRGLENYLKSSNADRVITDLKTADSLLEKSNIEDPLGNFTVDQILKLADSGDTKALMKVTQQLHLAATNPKALKMILKAQAGNPVIKITNELFINSILSSPITHQVNMISTALNTALRPFQKIVGGVAEGDTATIKRAIKDLYYLTTATMESMYMASKAFMNNANIIDSANQTVDMSKLNAIDVSERGFGIKAIHGFYTLPQRFLMAEDEFFKQVNFRAFIRAEIWERASKMKFKNNDAYNKYIEGEFKKIINVVNKESMLGKLSKQNALLYKKARQYSQEATFTEDLMKGTSGKFIQDLVNDQPLLRQIIPFVRTPLNLLKQFNKANPITPYLAKSKLLRENFAFVKEQAEELASSDASVRAIAKGRTITGGAFWTVGLMTAYNINNPTARVAITGGLPANKAAREKLLATGFLPYSFRLHVTEEDIEKYGLEGQGYEVISHPELPDVKYVRGADGKLAYKYISYKRLDPFAMFLSTSADLMKVTGLLGEEAQLEKDSLYQTAMAAMYNNLADKSYLRGITELVQVMRNESSLNGYLMNRLATLAVPLSGLQKNVKTAINSGLFDEDKSGNIRMDRKIASGEFVGEDGQPSPKYAPMIMLARLINEISSKTPFGNAKARPMQHHITGEFIKIPVGFGKDELNPFTSGWSQKSLSNNDLVLTALQAVGQEFSPPTDVLKSEDRSGNGIYLDSDELANLISATAFIELYEGGKRQRMYDAMNQLLTSPAGIRLLNLIGALSNQRGKPISNEERRDLFRLTGNEFYLNADFDDSMRVDILDAARDDLGSLLSAIHTRYKKAAKEAFITSKGLPKGVTGLSKEKKLQYDKRIQDLLLWESAKRKNTTTEILKTNF